MDFAQRRSMTSMTYGFRQAYAYLTTLDKHIFVYMIDKRQTTFLTFCMSRIMWSLQGTSRSNFFVNLGGLHFVYNTTVYEMVFFFSPPLLGGKITLFFLVGEKKNTFWFFSCKEKVDWRKCQLKWNHPITFCDNFPNWWMIYVVQQSKSCTGWISSWVFPVVMSCTQCCEQKVTSILLIRWFMQNLVFF